MKLTAAEVAILLGVSRNTLLRWERNGTIPQSNRDIRGSRIYTPEHLEKILKLLSPKQIIIAKSAIAKAIRQKEYDTAQLKYLHDYC